jgi:predicted PurR-regulated permease PerM
MLETANVPPSRFDSPDQSSRPSASWPILILCWLAGIGALYVARDVCIPLVLALLLALLLMPLMRRLTAWRLPKLLSAFLLIAGVVILFAIGVLTLAGEAQRWLADTPQVLQRVSKLVPTETGPLKHLHKATTVLQDMSRPQEVEKPLQVEVASQDLMLAALGVSTHFIGAAVIVFVLAFFLLAFNTRLLAQAVETRDSPKDKRNIVELMRNIEDGVSRYLLTVTLINLGLGAVAAGLLALLKIPNPILWGVLVATLNYVPHVGAFVCMAVLFLVGAVTHESIGWGVATALGFAVLTSIESYFVTPFVLSRSLQLSPLAIILSILFWGWLWGIAGGLMAAPLLAMLKITCDQFESLQGVAAFLAGETREKLAQQQSIEA